MWLPPLVWARQHRAAACTPYNRESNAVFPRHHPPRLCPTSIRQRPTDLNHLKYTSHKHCNITPWKLLQNYVQQYDTKTYIDHWWRCYVSSSSTSSTQCVSTTTVDTGREPSYITLSLEFEPRCIAKQNQTCLSKASSQPLGKNLGLFPPAPQAPTTAIPERLFCNHLPSRQGADAPTSSYVHTTTITIVTK